MRRPLRSLTSVAASAALVLGLSACGDDDDVGAVATTVTTATDTSAVRQGDPQAGEEPVAGCHVLDQRPDHVYDAGDAGEVEIRRDGSTVTLVEVRPSQDWTVTEDDTDEDVVGLTFFDDDRRISLEAKVDDDQLLIEVCEG